MNEAIGICWNNVFLDKKFHDVCRRLQQPPRPDTIWTDTVLHERAHLSLDVHQVRHDRKNDQHDQNDLNERDYQKFHASKRSLLMSRRQAGTAVSCLSLSIMPLLPIFRYERLLNDGLVLAISLNTSSDVL